MQVIHIDDRIYNWEISPFWKLDLPQFFLQITKEETSTASFVQSVLIWYHSFKTLGKGLDLEWDLAGIEIRFFPQLMYVWCSVPRSKRFFSFFPPFSLCVEQSLQTVELPRAQQVCSHISLLPAARLAVRNFFFAQIHERYFKNCLLGLLSLNSHKRSK